MMVDLSGIEPLASSLRIMKRYRDRVIPKKAK
jgi:hypothetical protein